MRIWRMTTTLFLSLVAALSLASTHLPMPQTKTTHHTLPAFNAIEVSGAAHVLVDQVPSLKESVATINTIDGYPVNLAVKDHTLIVTITNEPHKFLPFVHLRLKEPLKQLVVNNHISMVVRHTDARDLKVVANNHASVELIGLVNVNNIQQNDQSNVNVQWVDSDSLTVNVNDQAKLTLAGATNKLIANAADSALVKAEYLRADSAWVKAENEAAIYITPVNSLSAFASNKGNVYYYKYPKRLNRNTTESGNVLQVAWHN